MSNISNKSNKEPDEYSVLRPLMSPALALITLCERLYSSYSNNESMLSDLASLDEAASQLRKLLHEDERKRQITDSKLRHDLHNILGLIKGYSELMLEEHGDQPIRNELETIHRACMILLETVDNIDFGSITEKATEVANAAAKSANLESQQRLKTTQPSTIAVVDDDIRNCELLSRYLKSAGHKILSFQSGKEVLQFLSRNEVDLVFLDLVMPEMDGLEVLSLLKGNERTREIPVIIVSGIQDTAGVVSCIETGAEDYLYKPFDPTLLRARLNASLDRKRWHDREKQYRQELEKSHNFIHQTFGRYVSDEVVANLLDKPEGLDLGGTRRKVSILMSDIRSFTPLCESLPPERVVTLLNNYLAKMSEIIMTYNGTINEIIGDAILAIFGAPVSREDDTDRAIACAIEMQLAMDGINEKNALIGLPDIYMGIGINTGEVIAGNIGSERRSKYGIVGHHVNLTARIESYTLGGEILASEFTIADTNTPLKIQRSFSKKPKGVADRVGIHQITGIKGNYNKYLKA